MKMSLYCLKDVRAREFTPIYESKNDDTAVRSYLETLKKMSPDVRSDYELFKVGDIDHETGVISPCLLLVSDYSGSGVPDPVVRKIQ